MGTPLGWPAIELVLPAAEGGTFSRNMLKWASVALLAALHVHSIVMTGLLAVLPSQRQDMATGGLT